jgi:hypothetical protein
MGRQSSNRVPSFSFGGRARRRSASLLLAGALSVVGPLSKNARDYPVNPPAGYEGPWPAPWWQ